MSLEGRIADGPGTPVLVEKARAVLPYDGGKVLIALPWQKAVNPLTAMCVAQIIDRRRCASSMHFGDAFVTHSRNSCADALLSSKCDWMLMVDDDMIIPFGEEEWFRTMTGFDFQKKFMEMNSLDRLMSHKKTLVGGLYFGRQPRGLPMYGEAFQPHEDAYCRRGPHDLIKATRWVATGCMLTHRSVFEDIEKRYPTLARGKDGKGGNWFTSTEASLSTQVQAVAQFLRNGGDVNHAAENLEAALAVAKFENPLGTGEDVAFCLRAKASGHQPYVDLGLVCGHIGSCVYGPSNTGKVK
jgi:hypothetical protein